MTAKKSLRKSLVVVPLADPDLWANDLRVQVAELGRQLRLWHNCTENPKIESLLQRVCQALKLAGWKGPVTVTSDHQPVALTQDVYPLRSTILVFSGTWLVPLSFIIDGNEIKLNVRSSESLDDAVTPHTEPGRKFVLVRQTMEGGIVLPLYKPISDLCSRKRLDPNDSITVYYSNTAQSREIIVNVTNHRGQQFPVPIQLDARGFKPESELHEQLLRQGRISPYYHCTLTAQKNVQSKITSDYLNYEYRQHTETIKTSVWCNAPTGPGKEVFVKRTWVFNDLVVKSGLTPPPCYDIVAIGTKKSQKKIVSPAENVFTYFETEEDFIIRGFVLQEGEAVDIRCAVTCVNVPNHPPYEEIELDGRKTVQDFVGFLNAPKGYTIYLKLQGMKIPLLTTSPQRLTDLCPDRAMEVEISKKVARAVGSLVDTWQFGEISQYNKIKTLAKDCFMFARKDNPGDVVLLTAAKMGTGMLRERITDLKKLRHPCILDCLGLAEVRGDVFTVHRGMPKVELLSNVITTPVFKGCSSTTKTRIIVGLAHALRYLHSQKIIHRDLSPSNIALDGQHRPYLKDSGTARIFDPDGHANLCMTLNVGVPIYMAPEIWSQAEEGRYDEKVDVWSFAMVCVEIATGKPPFATINFPRLMQMIATGRLPALPGSLRNGWFADLLQMCMEFDPSARPSFADILERMKAEQYQIFGDEDVEVLTNFVARIP